MSDSRRVNPAYALDVDLVILEYLTHTTIKAQIETARHLQNASEQDDGSVQSATTLLHVFDTFIALFKHNHPKLEFTPEQDFSIRLLQFAVAFTSRRLPALLSRENRKELHNHQKRTVDLRLRNWKRVQSPTHKSWVDFWTSGLPRLEQRRSTTKANRRVPLDNLLPYFLELSADVASRLGQSINEQWMRLAGEFMLQSAAESLLHYPMDEDELLQQRLALSFAWGAWDLEELREVLHSDAHNDAAEILGREEKISEMFEEADGEPDWPTIRSEYLSMFDVRDKGGNTVADGGRHVQRLLETSDRYPKEAFETNLIDFLEGLLKLEQKPLLLQIEEGAIEGMSAEQFADFKSKVFAPQGSMSLG